MSITKIILISLFSVIILIVIFTVGYKQFTRCKHLLFGTRHATGLGYRRFINTVNIANVLFRYKEEKGHYPKRLSDLVPIYISSKNVDILYGPKIGISRDWREKRKSLINSKKHFDGNFAYFYFGGDGIDKGMILCEKPGLWKKDKQIAPDILCILFPDGSVKSYSLDERKKAGLEKVLQERLNKPTPSTINTKDENARFVDDFSEGVGRKRGALSPPASKTGRIKENKYSDYILKESDNICLIY